MLDASLVAQGKRMAIASNQWQDKDSTITQLPFETGEPGTYVVGVSTKARNIALTAEKFNSYLELLDVMGASEEEIEPREDIDINSILNDTIQDSIVPEE